MSKRAELRRTQREEKRANTATYNLTQAQLDTIVNEKIGKKIAETKQEIYEETVNTVISFGSYITFGSSYGPLLAEELSTEIAGVCR